MLRHYGTDRDSLRRRPRWKTMSALPNEPRSVASSVNYSRSPIIYQIDRIFLLLLFLLRIFAHYLLVYATIYRSSCYLDWRDAQSPRERKRQIERERGGKEEGRERERVLVTSRIYYRILSGQKYRSRSPKDARHVISSEVAWHWHTHISDRYRNVREIFITYLRNVSRHRALFLLPRPRYLYAIMPANQDFPRTSYSSNR